MATDDSFIATRLLLLCNGTDGSTTFTDNSYAPLAITANGNAHITTATKKYGTGSAVFDGTGDYLSAGVADDWTWMHLENAKWTFEAWVSATNFSAARTIFSTNGGSWSYSGVRIGIGATTGLVYFEVDRGVVSTAVVDDTFATAVPNDSLFHHIAITYDNSLATDNATLYIDGIYSGSLSKTGYASGSGAAQTPARIGGVGTTGNFLGYIDDMRITKDAIRYAANFTPPTEELPTTQTPLTVSAVATDDSFIATRLLLLCNGTDGSTTFTDNSYAPLAITANGNAHITTATKKYGTGSAVFDGTGDYLSAGVADDWTWMHLENAKWTFETWASATNFSAARTIFSTNGGSWSYSGVKIEISATTRLVYFEVDRGVVSTVVVDGTFATAVPNDSLFHHIAITYDNSLATDNATLYIDGIYSGSLSKTGYASGSGAAQTPARIGGVGTTGNFLGYIDDMRITKDAIRYAANFTPPTEELPTTQTPLTVSAVVTLPLLTINVGSGPSALITLPALSAVGYSGLNLNVKLPALVYDITTGANSNTSLPAMRSVSSGHDSTGEQAAEITLPSLSFSTTTGANAKLTLPGLSSSASGTNTILVRATVELPSLTSSASSRVSGMVVADLKLPSITAKAYTGAQASATLPSLTAAAQATCGGVASPGIILPSLSATATGGASSAISLPTLTAAATALVGGAGRADISMPSIGSIAYSGAVISITLGALTTHATGLTGGTAQAQITLPLFEATGYATLTPTITAAITLPSLRMGTTSRAAVSLPPLSLVAIGTAVVAVSYEAYAVNLKHSPRGNEQPVDETTRYTNFPFTHVVRYKNSYFGANSTGLYLLEGTTDNGTDIPWAVKTAMDDFKTPTKKTIASAYFSGRFGPASTVQLHAGEQAPNTYNFSTPRDALAQNHRQVFGKGVKERYFALGASGTGTVELDGVELDVRETKRRI